MLVGIPVEDEREYRVRAVIDIEMRRWREGYDWTDAPELGYPVNASLVEWFHHIGVYHAVAGCASDQGKRD